MAREIIKRNLDVRAAAKSAGVFLWEIADKLGVSEPTFIRSLRKELSDARKANVLAAIEDIKREHEN
ncbi:MAG: hypothetical protein NC452_06025 [Eubacterium sp.]|nr:hypothetical protein [Eubacterium sp.]